AHDGNQSEFGHNFDLVGPKGTTDFLDEIIHLSTKICLIYDDVDAINARWHMFNTHPLAAKDVEQLVSEADFLVHQHLLDANHLEVIFAGDACNGRTLVFRLA